MHFLFSSWNVFKTRVFLTEKKTRRMLKVNLGSNLNLKADYDWVDCDIVLVYKNMLSNQASPIRLFWELEAQLQYC